MRDYGRVGRDSGSIQIWSAAVCCWGSTGSVGPRLTRLKVAKIKRYLLCAFTYISGFLPCLGYAQSLDSLRRDFENPPKEVRPMVRWWWPGGDVTTGELPREVRVLDEAGFGGAETHTFRIGL